MQVRADFDDLHDQLMKIKEKIEKKLTGMVQNFSYNIAVNAIDLTPINQNFEATSGFYFNRARLNWGLGIMPGHAKGGWTLTVNEKSNYKWNMVANGEDATNVKAAADDASMQYKLGDDIFLVNNVPYVATEGWTLPHFGSLESGYSEQAPNGISRPLIATIFSQDLKRMYDQA